MNTKDQESGFNAPGAPDEVVRARARVLITAAKALNRTCALRRYADSAMLISLADEAATSVPVGSPATRAAAFVERRAEEERTYAEEAVARLPVMWLGLLSAGIGDVRKALTALGVDIIACVARPMSAHAAAEFVTPLGLELARHAADQRSRADVPVPPAWLLSAWEGVARGIEHQGDSLAYECGLRVAGDLFQRLPKEFRTLAERVSRTTIARVLASQATIDLNDDRLAAAIVGWMLADARRFVAQATDTE
ncbi:MAG: hypothetical protein JNK25_09440 [Phycisphaerae bacterium]|nr:hypothetical protein [Phycisphaerae bacterium]